MGKPYSAILWNSTCSCVVARQGRFSTKSDVWSFGVTTWEVLTFAHETPLSSLSDEQVVDNCERWYHSDDQSSSGPAAMLDRPSLCPREIYDLLRECWQRDEERRPTFHEVHMFLRRKNSGYNPRDESRAVASTLARIGGPKTPKEPIAGSYASNTLAVTSVPSFV